MRRVTIIRTALLWAMTVIGADLPELGAQPAKAQAQGQPAAGPAVKRLCKQRFEWSSTGNSRAEAQRKAIDGWSAAVATAHGEGFTKWAIAGIARVQCAQTPEGHRCRAAASPCRDLTEASGGKR